MAKRLSVLARGQPPQVRDDAGVGTAVEPATTAATAVEPPATAARRERRYVRVGEAPGVRVPALLAGAAGWCWRILVVAAAFFLLFLLIDKLSLIVLPFLAAMLISALLHPIVVFLRRRLRLPRALATWGTILIAFAVLGGVGLFVVNRASADWPQLAGQVDKLVTQVQHFLVNGPLHLKASSVDNVGRKVTDFLSHNSGTIASGLVTATTTLVDVITALILCFFMTFFLLYDGDHIWGWVIRLFPARSEERLRGSGQRIWKTLSGYIGGTFCVATFHGVVIGVTLWLVGVALVAPLAVLVFIGSFIPIVGAVIFGGLAVLVALITVGPTAGVIVLIVLIIENQIEGHLLQPLVVGRYVRLHPLAIVVALTGGALLAGLPGAIFSVPIVAAANAAVKFLSGREDAHGEALPDARAQAKQEAAVDAAEQAPEETTAAAPSDADRPSPDEREQVVAGVGLGQRGVGAPTGSHRDH